jgi:hypothetical protein
VWREGFGIEIAFEVLMAQEEVQNCYVIIRNDCAPALACVECEFTGLQFRGRFGWASCMRLVSSSSAKRWTMGRESTPARC